MNDQKPAPDPSAPFVRTVHIEYTDGSFDRIQFLRDPRMMPLCRVTRMTGNEAQTTVISDGGTAGWLFATAATGAFLNYQSLTRNPTVRKLLVAWYGETEMVGKESEQSLVPQPRSEHSPS